jgi:hypothetical protein
VTVETPVGRTAQEHHVQNSIRDGYLVKFRFQKLDEDLVVFLIFERKGQTVELELLGVTEFSFEYQRGNFPLCVEFVKCLIDEGGFYLSLDPWKEAERFASENDNEVFRSKSFGLTIS